MSRIDRNILRLGAYELVFEPDVTPSIAINEAIEISKRYGTEQSPTFVNGVLDRIASALEAKTATTLPILGTVDDLESKIVAVKA